MRALLAALLILPAIAMAQPQELEDGVLSDVTGQDGLSIRRLHFEFGGEAQGSGTSVFKTNSIYFGFDEATGSKAAYLAYEHLHGYIDFQTPLLIDVVSNGLGNPDSVMFTLPQYIDIDLAWDSISVQGSLGVAREQVNIVSQTGVVQRQEYEPINNLGSTQFVGRVQFNSGSWIKMFGH